jgi:hypothetical protein
MTKRDVAAFLLGVFATIAVSRWYALEAASYKHEMHINYIEGFLEQASGGSR